jgi:hypothetical protein
MEGEAGSSTSHGRAGQPFEFCLQHFIQRLQQRLTVQELDLFWKGETLAHTHVVTFICLQAAFLNMLVCAHA